MTTLDDAARDALEANDGNVLAAVRVMRDSCWGERYTTAEIFKDRK